MGDGGSLAYEGQLKGHRGWVTALACPTCVDPKNPIKVVSASRDESIVTWKAATRHSHEGEYAIPDRRLEGHSGFISDIALMNNQDVALSSSWDQSLRLWNLKTGETIRKFNGHTKDVLSAAFDPQKDRRIISGGRDNVLRMWNLNGELVFTNNRDNHTDWVSAIRFSPVQSTNQQTFVTGGWDNVVKVWNLKDFSCQSTLHGHKGYVSSVTVSPDGSLCASAGRDGVAKLWDLHRGELLYDLECGEEITQVAFSPNRYWLCAATEGATRIWDLEKKEVVAELIPETQKKTAKPICTSVAWSIDGSTLYTGYTDNTVRVWGVRDS